MKILLVFGTRPEAIKMAPLVKAFENKSQYFDTKVCVTAQHREMLDQVLDLFQIIPDYDLNIMKAGQDLFDVTSEVLIGLRAVLDEFEPSVVFVHGDTTTSFAAALSAFYKNIRVAHVEAGLRTYNLAAPWPEEANRQLTGRIADYNFAPTKRAETHLKTEGRDEGSIIVTGNTVIDALHWVLEHYSSVEMISQIDTILINAGYKITDRNYILVTGHRRENFGTGFENICSAIKDLSNKYPEWDIVYPVHLNPNVRNTVLKELNNVDNIYLIEPLEYKVFSYLMKHSKIVLTDSGGIQEEAPSLGKPVVVMRDTTERPEAVDAGTVTLVGTDREKIVNKISLLIDSADEYSRMSRAHNPYGDGKACVRIVEHMIKVLNK